MSSLGWLLTVIGVSTVVSMMLIFTVGTTRRRRRRASFGRRIRRAMRSH